MESNVYLYINILEGPGNYFSMYFKESNGFAHLYFFFFLFLLLYAEWNQFLPYATSVVNKRFYQTEWSDLTPVWYSENIIVNVVC